MPMPLSALDRGLSRNFPQPASARFASVPPEETAFAMSIFVGAANGQIASSTSRESQEENAFLHEGRMYLNLWATSTQPPTGSSRVAHPCPNTLDSAFMTLWKHYRTDTRRTSLCARVLGFHLLMERTQGAAIQNWVSPCPNSPETVIIDPAVIETLAIVPMTHDGFLLEPAFLAMLHARRHLRSPQLPHFGPQADR